MSAKLSSFLVLPPGSKLADYFAGFATALDIAPEASRAEFIQQDALAFMLDHKALELDRQAALSSLGLPSEGDWEYAERPKVTNVGDCASTGER